MVVRWEDNWLTDIYLPFNSVFYIENVRVKNYAGISNTDGRSAGSADPRYEVVDGRRLPTFYVEEVEQGRKKILSLLTRSLSADEQLMREIPGSNRLSRLNSLNFANGIIESKKWQQSYTGVTNMSFCHNIKKLPTTIACMSIAPHGKAINQS
jgi:hypothetical protein